MSHENVEETDRAAYQRLEALSPERKKTRALLLIRNRSPQEIEDYIRKLIQRYFEEQGHLWIQTPDHFLGILILHYLEKHDGPGFRSNPEGYKFTQESQAILNILAQSVIEQSIAENNYLYNLHAFGGNLNETLWRPLLLKDSVIKQQEVERLVTTPNWSSSLLLSNLSEETKKSLEDPVNHEHGRLNEALQVNPYLDDEDKKRGIQLIALIDRLNGLKPNLRPQWHRVLQDTTRLFQFDCQPADYLTDVQFSEQEFSGRDRQLFDEIKGIFSKKIRINPSLPEDEQEKQRYQQNLSKLKAFIPDIIPPDISPKVSHFLNKIHALIDSIEQADIPISQKSKIEILQYTNQLFEGGITAKQYKKIAQKMAGSGSPGLRALGGLMTAVAIAAVGLVVAFGLTGGFSLITSTAAMIGVIAGSATGIGLFGSGGIALNRIQQDKGPAKAGKEMVKTYEPQHVHKPK